MVARREGFVARIEKEAFVRSATEARPPETPPACPPSPLVEDLLAEVRARIQRAKSDNRTPFERWADNITQRTVDCIANAGEKDNDCLKRLRELGVIDERNRLIPKNERFARRKA